MGISRWIRVRGAVLRIKQDTKQKLWSLLSLYSYIGIDRNVVGLITV